jgi:hypothetical protein
VNADGTGLEVVPGVTLPGGQVVPVLQIVGGEWTATGARLPGEPVNPFGNYSIGEVFVFDGTDVLQLTNFRRIDTSFFGPFYSKRDQRVYFTASEDPFGTNPTENCQIFSIEPISREMRQLTFFRESDGRVRYGCVEAPPPDGCRMDFMAGGAAQNPDTGTIYFRSTCDPLGQNPYGAQIFAMQPDGSGLRQLTDARGLFFAEDGTLEVEIVESFLRAPYRW